MTAPIKASEVGLKSHYKVRVGFPGYVVHLASWTEPEQSVGPRVDCHVDRRPRLRRHDRLHRLGPGDLGDMEVLALRQATVIPEQLALDLGREHGLESVGVDIRRPTRSDLGLKKLAPGPQRLLGELLRRGLAEDDLHAAARIALVLDERGVPG